MDRNKPSFKSRKSEEALLELAHGCLRESFASGIDAIHPLHKWGLSAPRHCLGERPALQPRRW
ncbi:MAG: hypothetical protein MI924_39240 [Chloroflexales bacterium]|nr:hypothetical protein [Chloroflexales bacterium]